MAVLIEDFEQMQTVVLAVRDLLFVSSRGS